MKKNSKLKITHSEWIAELTKFGQMSADVVPQGWYTSVQLAEIWGKSRSHTQRCVFLMDGQGMIEKRKFRVKRGDREAYTVLHYRLKK